MENKQGSVVVYGLMVGLVILILGLALAPAVSEFTTGAMNETTGLNCSSELISNFDKAACVANDLTLLYFIGGVILIAGAIITAKIVFV